MTDEAEMGGRADRDALDMFHDEPEPAAEQPPKCRPLTVVDVLRLADRPMNDIPAPKFATAAMVVAIVRMMAKPGLGKTVDVADTCAALISAPVPVVAQALIKLLKTERVFSVSGLIAAVDEIQAEQNRTNLSAAAPDEAMRTTPEVQA